MNIVKIVQPILVAGILLTVSLTYSQQLISGKILDSAGNQIDFASIIENNTSFGTTSDEKGDFLLNIKKFPTTVTISSPYHTQKTIYVTSNKKITIILKREHTKMSSVEK